MRVDIGDATRAMSRLIIPEQRFLSAASAHAECASKFGLGDSPAVFTKLASESMRGIGVHFRRNTQGLMNRQRGGDGKVTGLLIG